MNCLIARQTLELARRDEPDADDRTPGNRSRATVEEAARHVEDCAACRTAVRRQRQFDHQVGVMIRESPVPADLKERLLARLEAEARTQVSDRPDAATSTAAVSPVAGPAVAAPAAARSQVGSRRRSLKAIALAAACVIAGVGTWSLWPVPPAISPDKVASLLATDNLSPGGLAAFTKFASRQLPKLPETMTSSGLIDPPRRLDEDEQDVAVYFFATSRRGPLDGRLAVIPKRRVAASALPQATSFLGPPEATYYENGFCVTAWVEGEFVYICCVKGGENKLHDLLPARTPPA